jgi:ABC-type antimicrobial peptide transport system permease subunit
LCSPTVDYILARPRSFEEIPAAVSQITELLRERHLPTGEGQDDFTVRDFKEALERVESTVGLVTGLVLIVSLISLAVGGVGIMNIMLVSVTERTREIGIRMAVGAGAPAILRQFLTEAVALSVLGGSVGIGVGRGAALLIRSLARWPTEPSALALVASVAVSVGVGAAFGYYPAWRASRLAPIEALRHD